MVNIGISESLRSPASVGRVWNVNGIESFGRDWMSGHSLS